MERSSDGNIDGLKLDGSVEVTVTVAEPSLLYGDETGTESKLKHDISMGVHVAIETEAVDSDGHQWIVLLFEFEFEIITKFLFTKRYQHYYYQHVIYVEAIIINEYERHHRKYCYCCYIK